MAMNTGENEQGIKKIIDLIRSIAFVILFIHLYYNFYEVFEGWQLTSEISDRLLHNISKTGLLSDSLKTKVISLGLLALSLFGVKGKKNELLTVKSALAYLIPGVTVFFGSELIKYVGIQNIIVLFGAYSGTMLIGCVMMITGAGMLTRIIKNSLSGDKFNRGNETFPQEERLLTNEFSINLPAEYNLKDKVRPSWINIINPMRGVLVIGSPGSGKSYFVIENVIRQHIEKGFSMFIYDFKYDDLTSLAFAHFQKFKHCYADIPEFYIINFDDLDRSQRCNPLDPENMLDITDAVEAARVILLGLNRSWLKKQGDFFVESPINFLTALIWFLRKYENGVYCTLPHVIELMQVEIEKLFTILRTEPEIDAYINPFISAFQTNSSEQLEGQLDAAKISLARLSSPGLYYSLSGNDFTLDINNPEAPKIVCLGNNPQKQDVYGPILSLYMTRLSKIINKKDKLKSSLIIDEFTTLTFLGLDTLIATGRSNKIATTIAIQDTSQLKLHYGRELADVIVNICGNIVVGQVGGDIAKQISERLGKILQDRESVSINSNDTSITKSKQLDVAVPVSTISSLSSGEFVGMVSDNPDQPIELKTFHSRIKQKPRNISKSEPLTFKSKSVSEQMVFNNYKLIKTDIQTMIEVILDDIYNDPAKSNFVLQKP